MRTLACDKFNSIADLLSAWQIFCGTIYLYVDWLATHTIPISSPGYCRFHRSGVVSNSLKGTKRLIFTVPYDLA